MVDPAKREMSLTPLWIAVAIHAQGALRFCHASERPSQSTCKSMPPHYPYAPANTFSTYPISERLEVHHCPLPYVSMCEDDIVKQFKQLSWQQGLRSHPVGQHKRQGLLQWLLCHDGSVKVATEKWLLGSILSRLLPASRRYINSNLKAPPVPGSKTNTNRLRREPKSEQLR